MKNWKPLIFALVLMAGFSGGIYGFLDYQEDRKEIYKVVRIIDGDTIEVAQDNKTQSVRLLGIDAPERKECYYQESSQFLRELLLGESIALQADPLNENTDEYGRLLRYVHAGDVFVNQVMVEAGMAEYLDFFPITFDIQFEILEQQAKEADKGLWGEC